LRLILALFAVSGVILTVIWMTFLKTSYPSKEGAVQGGPLSPLLSNIVLDELDQELEKHGLEFCRFADDCNIFVKSQKAAERVMEKVSQFIEKKLKLKVNREKSQVAKSDQVKFLGFTVVNGTIAIAHKALY
jgi:RNA-directed DNA polymerase